MAFQKTGFNTGQETGITLEASVTTSGFIVGQKHKLSIQAIIANTDAVGTLAIEGSNDGTNWVTVGFKDETDTAQTTLTVASGTDVNHVFSINDAVLAQYRVVYTRTSGSASNTLALHALSKKSF